MPRRVSAAAGAIDAIMKANSDAVTRLTPASSLTRVRFDSEPEGFRFFATVAMAPACYIPRIGHDVAIGIAGLLCGDAAAALSGLHVLRRFFFFGLSFCVLVNAVGKLGAVAFSG